MMSSPTAATATTTTSSSSIPIHVSERRRLPSDGLNPRRIQTGLPGIRRTVYDGALRVNSDAQDVLCATLRDVAASIETNPNHNNNSSNNNGNDNNLVTKVSLAAKPELRKYFPLNALPRPSMDDTPHDDEFHIPITNKKRRTTIHITELTNHIVTTQQSRIVNPTTGERALCAVESVETVAKNELVEILDSGLIESDDDEEPPEQVENENRHANGQDGGGVVVGAAEDAEAVVVIPIRGGVARHQQNKYDG